MSTESECKNAGDHTGRRTGHRAPGNGHQVLGDRCSVPGTRCSVPGARCSVLGPGARCSVHTVLGARCSAWLLAISDIIAIVTVIAFSNSIIVMIITATTRINAPTKH